MYFKLYDFFSKGRPVVALATEFALTVYKSIFFRFFPIIIQTHGNHTRFGIVILNFCNLIRKKNVPVRPLFTWVIFKVENV